MGLQHAEPVLLVGETGSGKSTLVMRLAALTGRPLVAFNLSQQTDSGDLLGGFKPVEARDALGPLLPQFADLVRRTWPRWVAISGGSEDMRRSRGMRGSWEAHPPWRITHGG